MPKFVYVGDEGRVYPTLPPPANGPLVGSTYTLEKDPGDNRWRLVVKPAKPVNPPTENPAPAGDTTKE